MEHRLRIRFTMMVDIRAGIIIIITMVETMGGTTRMGAMGADIREEMGVGIRGAGMVGEEVVVEEMEGVGVGVDSRL